RAAARDGDAGDRLGALAAPSVRRARLQHQSDERRSDRTFSGRRDFADQQHGDPQCGRRSARDQPVRRPKLPPSDRRPRRPTHRHRVRGPMTEHRRYSSPLAERYASTAMLELWSPVTRYGLWRQLWLALAEAERELGVPIPDEALAEMRAHLDDVDFDAVAVYERRFRHDVMAHVHAFADAAPAARPFIHYGATS